MIHSAEELREKIRAFEYEQPESISTVPSIALRQAVQDVRHVVSKGARIKMSRYGAINGQCEVCCAGAVLLARGYFGNNAEKAYEHNADVSAQSSLEEVELDDGGFWQNREANNIGDVFNDVRLGHFVALLQRGGLAMSEARELHSELQSRFPFCYSDNLSTADVESMCTDLLAVAEYLEQKGL